MRHQLEDQGMGYNRGRTIIGAGVKSDIFAKGRGKQFRRGKGKLCRATPLSLRLFKAYCSKC